MGKSIADAVRELAMVVNPSIQHQLAAFQNPLALVSDSIFILATVALCAVAIGMVCSSRRARKSPPPVPRNRLRVVGASATPRPIRINPHGPHPVLRLAPGRRGKT